MPNLFLVGAPKCGTTALSSYLAGHSDIFMSEDVTSRISRNGVPYLKEPGFYAEDHKNLFSARRVFDKSEYLAIFADADPSVRWRGEATVNYLMSKVAIPEIVKDVPDARFIVCIRNPVDLAQSMHGHRVKSGTENIINFRDAWYAQEERLQGKRLPSGTANTPQAYQYGDMARIGSQLSRMLSYVAREQVHVVIMDDMKRDMLPVYKDLLAFLDVPYDGRQHFPVTNESRREKSESVARLLVFASALRKRLPIPGLGLGLLSGLYGMNLKSGKSEMDESLRVEIQDYFRKDVELLSQLIGRDLTGWTNK